MNTTKRLPLFEGLLEDRSGAIAVMATFQCAFVVGMIWYVIGAGDSVLYRQAMQDGADTVAYAATVYHARGMNLIAFLNIIMAAILAVLIIMKVIQVLNYIAVGVSAVMCAIPFTAAVGCPINSFTDGLISPIQDAVDTTQNIVNNVLPVLHTAETAIAIAYPTVFAEAKAIVVGKDIKAPVNFGAALSPSMIPMLMGKDGLPVTDDKFEILCEKSAKMVADLIASPFGIVPGLKSIVSSLISGTITAFQGYFCGDSASPDVPQLNPDDVCNDQHKQIDESRKMVQACQDQKQACKANGQPTGPTDSCATTADCSDKNSRGDMPDPFNEQTCKDNQKQAAKQQKQVAKSGTTKPSEEQKKNSSPKKVIDDAHNGNGYMTVIGVTFGDTDTHFKGDRQGIDIATWGKASASAAGGFDVSSIISAISFLNFTRAEFYYDCDAGWDSENCNQDSNAMWHMRWKVKLRRVTAKMLKVPGFNLGDQVAQAASGIIGDALSNVAASGLGDVMNSALGGGGGTNVIAGMLQDGLNSMVHSYVDSALSELSSGFGASSDPNNPHGSYVDQAKSYLNSTGQSAIAQVNGMLGNGSYGVMH